jgi:hypothetical protein
MKITQKSSEIKAELLLQKRKASKGLDQTWSEINKNKADK